MRRTAVLLLTLLASCGQYPRDQDGTFDRIRQSGQLRIGLTAIEPADAGPSARFVSDLARATGARPTVSEGAAESQLALLEEGKLDLVLGEFAEDSPWLDDVAVIEPLTRRTRGERVVGLAPVAANGENAWIMLVEQVVRDTRKRPVR